ncbi:MAG: CBS domain-containing protein [Solirubrobacterales bacterium]
MQLREIMTAGVVTADEGDQALDVARLMRDRGVSKPVGRHASRPLITGEPEMELEEAAALMVQHRLRRLPVIDGGSLAGIVSLDDIAVRSGNLEVAQRMTADVIEGALPDFYFHERG